MYKYNVEYSLGAGREIKSSGLEMGKKIKSLKTRPDTRPSVADGWAGAEMQLSATKNVLKCSFPHFSTRVHGPTNGRMDGQSLL